VPDLLLCSVWPSCNHSGNGFFRSVMLHHVMQWCPACLVWYDVARCGMWVESKVVILCIIVSLCAAWTQGKGVYGKRVVVDSQALSPYRLAVHWQLGTIG
jgi:hypothetical protein